MSAPAATTPIRRIDVGLAAKSMEGMHGPMPRRGVPSALYTMIRDTLPLPVTDLIIQTPDGIPLGRRQNYPIRGWLCFPGGRIVFGEQGADQAAMRIAREEAGVEVELVRMVGVYSLEYHTTEIRHDIDTIWLARLKRGTLRTDTQHSKFVFVNDSNIEHTGYLIPPFVLDALKASGVIGKEPSAEPVYRHFNDPETLES